MYGLPKNIELGFLFKKELQSVSIGLHDVILHFDERVTITVTSECKYQTKTGEGVPIENFPASASLICQLINHSIVEAQRAENGTLSLKFSNEDALIIYDDSEQYESYQIQNGDKLIVV
jgi:hypothetical protein